MRRVRQSVQRVALCAVAAALPAAALACGAPSAAEDASSAEPFEAVNSGLLVEYQGISRGAAWGDFDSDGDPDLFVSYPTFEGPEQNNGLYRNDGGVLVFHESDISATRPGGWQGATWVDVDGDRDLDLHVVGRNGAGSQFYENESGTLTALTTDPFGGRVHSASMACWADADGDGYLDAFVVGSGEDTNHLFHNRGDWTFDRVSLSDVAEAGGRSRACVWVALEDEAHPALVIANARTPNVLLRNQGGMALVADEESVVPLNVDYSYGLSAADINGDGIQDVFVANFDVGNSLLLGTADGRLEERPLGESLQSAASKGHVWADFDLDGWLDLYLGSGTPRPGMLNRLWRGMPDGGFQLDTAGEYLLDADTSAAVAGADIDADGDIDLFVANWGSPGSFDRLYQNNASGHWLHVDLEGSAPNTMGVGARVSALVERGGEEVWLHRWVTLSTGYAGQNDPRIHFGLGDARHIERIEVRWPSGVTTVVTDVEADQVLRVSEGA